MKSMVAALISALLCVQPVCTIPVCAMPEREVILYEDAQEKTGRDADTERNTDGQKNEEKQENTQEEVIVRQKNEGKQEDTQEEINTQGEVGAAGENKEAEEQAGSGEQEQTESQDQGSTAGGMEVSAPSAILMEASTGQVIFEKDADTKRPPASVTKVMTLLLIFDALDGGKISLEDTVTTSEYAASMGGSQVFLEVGETQTVDTMIKCISVASANDACVAFKYSRQMRL